MDECLVENIVECIGEEYSKLKPSAKPVTRSNGTKEWTVLASIVSINKNTDEIRIISLATGVKSLPNDELSRSEGKMLHDCHAEILAMRGFNAMLLKHMLDIKNGVESDLIEKIPKQSKYKWKDEWKLALYISRLPCGDASMNSLEDSCEDSRDVNINNDDPFQYIDENNHTIIRGRLNFNKKGIVRTKPGRHDSKITLSKSCSDKVCIKQAASLLNTLTWELMEQPIYLDYLIVPDLNDSDMLGLKRCFRTRLANYRKPIGHFEVISCNIKFVDDKQSEKEDPSPISSISLYINKANKIEQVILNGIKNGFFSKGTKPLRKNCESIVSRYAQFKLYTQITSGDSRSYLEIKHDQKERRAIIDSFRECISPDGWICTLTDNCIK